MLPPEDRQRIEQEEQRRAAEEQYRAEVKAKLKSPRSSRANWGWIIALSLLGGIIVTLYFVAQIPPMLRR